MNVSGQTEPPEQRYKLRHGAFGEQRIEHNNLLEAGFNLDSTFGIRYVDYPEESRPNTVGRFYNTLELKSAYKNGESTSYMSDGSFCVDYILHNPRLAVDDTQESVFEQLPILILNDEKHRKNTEKSLTIPACECLPNEHFGSDHLSLSVNFSFQWDQKRVIYCCSSCL